MHAYLEPSAISAAVAAKLTPTDLRTRLAAIDFEPASGLHSLHEQGRNVVRGRFEVAKEIFRFVLALDPVFHQPADDLLAQELAFVRGSHWIEPALDAVNVALTRSELRLLAKGNISAELRRLIVQRDADIEANWPASSAWYLDQVAALRTKDPTAAPRPATFEDVLTRMQSSLGTWVLGLGAPKMTRAEAERVVRNLDTLLAHRTQLRLWMYMAFICLRDKVTPAHDRLDDFRHVLESSYCGAIVTNDEKLARATPHLHPELRVIRWAEIANA